MAENLLTPIEYNPDNQRIAERIQKLFVKVNAQGRGYVVWDKREDRFSIAMEVVDSRGVFFRGGVDIKLKLPSDLEYPIYVLDFITFQYLDVKTKQAQNTPYGRLPTFVIGPNNELYDFATYYFFNSRGMGFKYEDVSYSLGDPSFFFSPQRDELRADVGQVEFTPNEEDSRFMPLEPGDYEMIEEYLNMIESGEFRAIAK